MKPILEASDVTFTYPGAQTPSLHQLNIRIPEGKRTAICGPNGSGKSTFFLHAVGIHRPKSGTMLWKDAPYVYKNEDLQRLRRQVGLVFQDPEQQLILHTTYEDVSYGLRNARLEEQEIRRRTERMLDVMGLTPWAETPLHQLSLGLKKRVALAGVLVLEPELLLLDEPTAYLDRRSEHRLVEELNRIHGQGITVAMATHDLNMAYAWADWILVMYEGACVMEGTPEHVFTEADVLAAYGLELPALVELWKALPADRRLGAKPPRDIAAWKAMQETWR
ncbi:energy-coupling factor ABC transporter ATP-binding protein [Paenibacillus sp.]|uniref:energy-coupling factor ABC transporter ATP-binding protein n=1 Tax=Paenibacillus sp. TaxID=58172 RepID=UPI003568C479